MKRFNVVWKTPAAILLILGWAAAGAQAQFAGMGQQSRGFMGSTSSSYQRTYTPQGMVGEAIIEADYDTRSIIVITDEETNTHIGDIIKSLDHPVQQVLINVVFLEVTYRDDSDIGIEGSINASHGGKNGGILETVFGIAAETQGGFYRLLEDDFQVTLRALAEKGKLEILSRPSVLTRNNQEAVITVGKEVPFVTNSRVTSDGQTINTVEYQDIGIILRVTPFITQDGLVEMILAPEISTTTDETVPISDTLDSPVFAKRSADTVVRTPNGKTVVIGGMMEDSNTETLTKVPVLGDIPLLGLAFRRRVKNMSKTELLIFLTPYVVEGPDPLVELSKKEKEASNLIPQAFSEDQLNKFFDEQPKRNAPGNEPVDIQPAQLGPAENNAAPENTVPVKPEPAPKKKTTSKAGANAKKARDSKAVPSRAF